MSSYITQQGSILYFRLRVPDDVRSHLKQGEIKLSLRTSYRSHAKGRAMVMAGICLQVFEALRQGYEVSRKQFIDRLRESVDQACQFSLIQPEPSHLVRNPSTPTPQKPSATNASCLIGVSTQVQSTASSLPVHKVSTPIPVQVSDTNASEHIETSPQSKITLEGTVKEYLEESRPNWAKRTYEKIAPHLYEFLDLIEGRELSPEQLGLEHARQYKKYTPLIPRNQTKMKLYRNKPLLKVVRGKVSDKHKISAGSVSYRFTVVRLC